MSRTFRFATPIAAICLLSATAVAQETAGAQEEEAEAPANEGDVAAAEAEADGSSMDEMQGQLDATGGGSAELNLLSDEQALQEERAPEEEFRESTDPYEDPEKNYYFIGGFYRHLFVPTFVTELFLESAPSVNNPAGGVEFTYRKDGFDISAAVWYASYKFTVPFRASGDPEQDTEILDSDMYAIVANASFLWSTSFNKYVAVEYGLDVGIAIVGNTYTRTEAREAHPDDRSDEVYDGFAACSAPGDPRDRSGTFCDAPVDPDPNDGIPAPDTNSDSENGAHYGVQAQKWTQGGGVPNVLPWLGPHFAVRVKPIAQLALRAEFGFGLGFFTGLSAAYGF